MLITLLLAGIIISGYMAIRTAREERKIDEKLLEKEGEVYMERIRQARQQRQKGLGITRSFFFFKNSQKFFLHFFAFRVRIYIIT
ncbi:Sporulation protein YhaL [Anoxybacillus sp. BCO1]|nr:Sporulation protein YhaL [Anoxybacillus sp. BCO1]